MADIIFQTPRLSLRACQTQDAEFFNELFGNTHLMRYFHQQRPLENHEAQSFLDSFIKHDKRYGWGPGLIQLDDMPIGLGAITYLNHDSATQKGDLFYIIQQTHANKGYATEFTKGAVQFLFRHTDIQSILATAIPENKASIRVLEKSGFVFKKFVPEHNRNHYARTKPEI